MYENDYYNNLCSSVVFEQDLHSLLLEKGLCNNQLSESSLFATIVPRSSFQKFHAGCLYSDAIVDFVSCNVANDTLVHRRKLNPVAALDFKAKEKHRKYDKDIEEANVDRNTQLVFIAFPFSINGRLSDEARTFLNDFQKLVQEKTMKRFDIFLWRSRIQFAIINR
ncbi:hypothetical protein P9112_000697 [Eukaryota sp. TZLM1-RC]